MADWTMNSCLTTGACPPETFPSAACQRSRHQSAIKRRTEGGKVKERKKGEWEWHEEILRLWRENDSIHPQLENSETHVHHPSVPHSSLLPSGGVWRLGVCILSEQTPQRNNSLQCETEGRGSFLSFHPTQNDEIQFIFLEYQCKIPLWLNLAGWLCADFLTPPPSTLPAAALPALATHPDGRIDRRAQAARRRFNLLLDLTTLALTFFFVC